MIFDYGWVRKNSIRGVLTVKIKDDGITPDQLTEYVSDIGYEISVSQAASKPVIVKIKNITLEDSLHLVSKFKK